MRYLIFFTHVPSSFVLVPKAPHLSGYIQNVAILCPIRPFDLMSRLTLLLNCFQSIIGWLKFNRNCFWLVFRPDMCLVCICVLVSLELKRMRGAGEERREMEPWHQWQTMIAMSQKTGLASVLLGEWDWDCLFLGLVYRTLHYILCVSTHNSIKIFRIW